MINQYINDFVNLFLEKTKDKQIHLVSHFDTDGITSAAIFTKTLKRLSKQFSVKIIQTLTKEEIKAFPEDKIIILLDLGSGSLKELSKLQNEIFIIDHHEIKGKPHYKNINLLNPHILTEYENLCGAELTYLVSKKISKENKDLAHLSIIGMVGDTMGGEITKTRNTIIKEAAIKMKKGLLIYPSTRPLDRTLEYSSRPFIAGVTGNKKGVYELLNEAGIGMVGRTFKALIDLTEEEMQNLVTAVMLRMSPEEKEKEAEYLGNLYLIKFFNKIEDARELSAMINACSRMGYSGIAMLLCLGNNEAKKKAAKIYIKYRQHIISGLKHIDKDEKIQGKEYIIINAKDNIKDTIIGTLASILSFSSVYKEGTIIVAMAYNENKIKVSTRMAGRKAKANRNLKELMESITQVIGGISGGHKRAAGCLINKQDESKFIDLIQKKLDVEMIKI